MFGFFAGLVALKWLSSWLESGRWCLLGIYCLYPPSFDFPAWGLMAGGLLPGSKVTIHESQQILLATRNSPSIPALRRLVLD
jgi:hypothetical protein